MKLCLPRKYFQFAKRGSMGAESICLSKSSRKYLFGYCVLVFDFFCKDGMGLNDSYSQLSLFLLS